jgi:hypothetical protein
MTTIRTIKLKRNPASAPAVTPLDTQAPTEPHAEPQAVEAAQETLPEVPLAAEADVAAPVTQNGTFTLFAILGICSLIALLAIIGLQAFEWTFYAASPSVWPAK